MDCSCPCFSTLKNLVEKHATNMQVENCKQRNNAGQPRGLSDRSDFSLSKFMAWMDANNNYKSKKFVLLKKGNPTAYPVLHNIKQYNSICLMEVIIQSNNT